MILYATVIPITIYAVLDFEDPRSGLIRVDAADKALIQLRDSIRQWNRELIRWERAAVASAAKH